MRISDIRKILAVVACLMMVVFASSMRAASHQKTSDQELAAKARRLQRLVETKVLQEHGMIPMFVRASDYQLPTAEDFKGAYRHRHLQGKSEEEVGLPPMHVWRAWENTPLDTAFYLAAMAHQYRVTGDPEALAICRRTLGALKYIYSLPISRGERGFLVKPYGGVYSNQSSGDQMQSVTWGLAAYRPIAPPEDRADIDRMTTDFADFLIKNNYVSPHGYFARPVEDLRAAWKYTWQRAVTFLPTLYLAWEAGGDPRYIQEIQRWHEIASDENDLIVQWDRFSTSGYHGKRFLYLPTLLMSMDPSRHELWRKTMGSHFKQARTGILPDGTWPANWKYDSSTGQVTPEAKGGFGYGRTSRSAFFAVGCVAAQRWFPDLDMVGDARRILEGLDEKTFRFVMPLDENTPLPAEWQVEAELLDLDSLTAWLCAYWEGRYRGYW